MNIVSYATLCDEYNDIMTKNSTKIMHTAVVFSCYYLAFVRKVLLLQAHHDQCYSLVNLLCSYIYFCNIKLLNHN